MAFRSFWERLTAPEALPALIEATLEGEVDRLDSDASVYAGRMRKAVTSQVEVQILRGEASPVGDGGGDVRHEHRAALVVALKRPPGPKRSGYDQTLELERVCALLVRRLDGQRPLPYLLPEVIGCQAALLDADDDGDPTRAERVVETRWVTHGDGAELVGAGEAGYGGAM
jgi:hypothetical protein